MKKTSQAHLQLHLVTPEEAAAALAQTESAPATQNDEDAFIASGVRRYKQLQQEADRELFGKQDHERLQALWSELQVLRDRQHGFSIRQLAKTHRLSKTSVCRVLEESQRKEARHE